MSKKILLIVGIVIILMGVWGLLSNFTPTIAYIYDPLWHGILKIIVGAFCMIVALKDKAT
jgi:uncharacterized membrane protein HdeD (DUF308 family)